MNIFPGIRTSTVGLNRVITNGPTGFPGQGLQALYLFEDGAGTAVEDAMGGANGLIEHPEASDNAFSWLPGGGLQLEGTEIVTFPAFDVRGPWTLLSAGAITGSVGGTGSERRTTIIAFRDWPAFANVRGAAMIARGANDWNAPTTAPYYQVRPCDGAGTLGSPIDFLSTGPIIDTRLVRAMSYNGVDTLTAAVYDAQGQLVALGSCPVTDAILTTGLGGVVDNTLQPVIGGVNSTFGGGVQQIEGVARYDRVLSSVEIRAAASASAALGDDRTRPWA